MDRAMVENFSAAIAILIGGRRNVVMFRLFTFNRPSFPWQQEGQYRVETENEDGEWVGILMRVSGV